MKYIVDIEPIDVVFGSNNDSSKLYRIKGLDNVVVTDNNLNSFEKFDEKAIKESGVIDYLKSNPGTLSDILEERDTSQFSLGVREMWNTVRRLVLPKDCGCPDSLLQYTRDLFSDINLPGWQNRRIFMDYSPEDVISIVHEFDMIANRKDDELAVGDEIWITSGSGESRYRGVVFYISEDSIQGFFYPQSAIQPVHFKLTDTSNIKKTGRHFYGLARIMPSMKDNTGSKPC